MIDVCMDSGEQLIDDSLTLLMHVLLHIIKTTGCLSGRTAAFPPAEGLVSWPCACGCATGTVNVDDASLNII